MRREQFPRQLLYSHLEVQTVYSLHDPLCSNHFGKKLRRICTSLPPCGLARLASPSSIYCPLFLILAVFHAQKRRESVCRFAHLHQKRTYCTFAPAMALRFIIVRIFLLTSLIIKTDSARMSPTTHEGPRLIPSLAEKPRLDWWFTGSILLLAISILGFAYVLWETYR